MTRNQEIAFLARLDGMAQKPVKSVAWSGASGVESLQGGGLPSGGRARRIFVVLAAAASVTIGDHTHTAGGSAEEYIFDAPAGTYLDPLLRIEYSGVVAITLFYTL